MQCKILVVDDEHAIRDIFTRTLAREGYDAEAVSSGEAAIEAMEQKKYDLVFLDLRLPNIDGVETLKRIRNRDKDTPIYIASAFYADYMQELKSVSQEGLDFELVDKPVGRNQLMSIVRNVLSDPWQC
jgi:DNA-binding NtrC family response regulator